MVWKVMQEANAAGLYLQVMDWSEDFSTLVCCSSFTHPPAPDWEVQIFGLGWLSCHAQQLTRDGYNSWLQV